MGRVKLEIKRLENSSNRQSTYSKRKHGILKKAHELSVLCDVDLILIMFSPGGKPALCSGKSSIEEVIAKFNQVPPQERAKRKLEGLEALKKTFKKLDHDVDIPEFLGTSAPTIKDLTEQAGRIRTRLTETHERLRYWTNPDEVSDLEVLMQMEDSLNKSLAEIQRQKENFQKRQQQMLLETSTAMQIPYSVSDEHQLQSMLWSTSGGDIQHSVVTDEAKVPPQRGIESCTGSSSGGGNYFGCLTSTCKSEANSPGELSGINNNNHNNNNNIAAPQDTFQGLQFGAQNAFVSYAQNMAPVDNSLQGLLGMDQQQEGGGTLSYDAGRNYQHNAVNASSWLDFANHLTLESPADSAFFDYLNYQRLLGVPGLPGGTIPSTTYERIARVDPSHILFEGSQNHYA